MFKIGHDNIFLSSDMSKIFELAVAPLSNETDRLQHTRVSMQLEKKLDSCNNGLGLIPANCPGLAECSSQRGGCTCLMTRPSFARESSSSKYE